MDSAFFIAHSKYYNVKLLILISKYIPKKTLMTTNSGRSTGVIAPPPTSIPLDMDLDGIKPSFEAQR